jgi:hypothetical protein
VVPVPPGERHGTEGKVERNSRRHNPVNSGKLEARS